MSSLELHNEFKVVGVECSEDCNVSVNERESERYNFDITQNSKMFKSALKKHSSRPEKKQLRVTFSEAVTMFSEEFSEQQIITMSPTDLSLSDMCSMYEPPPQYQDWLDIKPPTEYQDTLEDITLTLEREFGSVVLNSESLKGHDFQVINNNCEAKESSNGEITTAHAFSEAVKTSNVTETQADIPVHPIIMETSTLCDTYLDKETEDKNKCVTLIRAKENNTISETENKSVIFQVSENISVLPSNITSNYYKKQSLESETPAVLPGLLKLAVKPLKLEKQPPNLLSSPKQLNKDLAHPRPEDENWQAQLSSPTSIREIDSDSSASSQETIIMMSSEASRGSDKQNRNVSDDTIGKTNKCLTSSVQGSKSTISFCAERENEGIGGLSKEHSNGIRRTSSQIRQTIEKNALRRRLQKKTRARKKNVIIDNFKSTLKSDSSLVEKLRWLTSEISEEQNGEELDEKITNEYSFVDVKNHEFNGGKQPENKTLVADQYFQPIERPLPTIIRKKHPIHWQRGFQKRPLSLGKEYEDFSSREKRLVSMMVPIEVRNWTIRSQYEKNELNAVTRNGNTHSLPISCRSENTSLYKPHVSHSGFLQGTRRGTTLDELEQFVKKDLLRIERIRKRFSLSEDLSYGFSRRPSVKGIRPRFGSTTEIMKQMQLQLQPPVLLCSKNVESHATRSNFDVYNDSYSRLLTKSRKSAVRLPRVTEDEEDNRTNIIPQTNHTYLSPKRNDVCSSGNGFSNHQQTQKTQEEIHAHFYKNGFTPLNQLDTSMCKEQKCSFFENKRVMPEDTSSSSKVVSDLVCHSIPTYGKSNPVEETGLIYYALNV
ncbi:uncharacterized protein LOC143223017 [Tachypleus tridentatus]|uniref:uncharacterized protein LOC143223017 n=1 Tax=Tachypleus tridentatus TaxID=6853 RepID=UPI003FD3133D